MPFHGLEPDLELVSLVVSAGVFSYFATGSVVSNILFTVLLATLFFLEGLHFDLQHLTTKIRDKPFGTGFLSVYLLIPILSLAFSLVYQSYSELFLVLGASSVSMMSPLVWSNISGGNGQLTEKLNAAMLGISIVGVPFLSLVVLNLNISLVGMAQKLHIILIPFMAGILLHNSKFEPIQNARFHFSKLAFWLITVITLVQLQLVLESQMLISVVSYLALTFVLGIYVFFSFLTGYIPSKLYDLNEKDSRSIGFISSARNIGIAFFLGSLIGNEIVLLVGIYYFERQVIGLALSDYFAHNEVKFLERIGLKG